MPSTRIAVSFARALAVAVLLALGGCSDGEAPPAAQGLVVTNPFGERPYFYDFQNVPFGDIVTHTFRLKNTDPVAVSVLDLTPSCGCTMPRMNVLLPDGTKIESNLGGDGPVISIPPYADAELVVRVDTTHVERMNIDKLAQVRLRCDSATSPFLTFELHIVVERAFRTVPPLIDLGFVPQSVGKHGRSDLTHERRGMAARVLDIRDVEGPIDAVLDETQVADETMWILSVTAKPGLPLGPVQGKVIVRTSGMDGTGVGPELSIPVIGQVADDVRVDPPILFVAPSDTRVEATLSALVPGERVRVLASRVDGSGTDTLRVECKAVRPADDGSASQWTIALVGDTNRTEPVSGELVLELDHPRVRVLRVLLRPRGG
ncbi:MAG: DUF1573 domain-containing protein [Planctomycetota bacterium]